MKKLAIFVLFLIFILISIFALDSDDKYKVVKVVSAFDFYVDFDKNNIADDDERIVLYDYLLAMDTLSNIDNAKLTYLADEYANKVLLEKSVTAFKVGPKQYKITLADNSDYVENLLFMGYVPSQSNGFKVQENLKKANTLDLVSYNTKTNKFHNLDCNFALKSVFEKVVMRNALKNDAKPCKFCIVGNINKKDFWGNNYPKDVIEQYKSIYKDGNLELFLTDFTKHYYPSNKCLTSLCKSLLNEINNAQTSIDFAIYGIDRQPEITSALINAKKRGVKIRWVYDVDKSGNTIYSETFELKKYLTEARSDLMLSQAILNDGKSIKDAIMHNKFFIFDNKIVWTGSANISHTDLSGFNSNSAVLIRNSKIAEIYKQEFEYMYNGNFHSLKNMPTQNIQDNNAIRVYFSPQDKIIDTQIIPLLKAAQKYVYVPVFVVTHSAFKDALISAKARGVDVKLIVDATSASSRYPAVKQLRDNGVLVKTENRAGKMHMKSIIIDDKYVVLGSMNFTKSGQNYNDENVVIINNMGLAKSFRDEFLHFYNVIPEKWLYNNPAAESINSINSCFDGVDNDFDGNIDLNDEGCKI